MPPGPIDELRVRPSDGDRADFRAACLLGHLLHGSAPQAIPTIAVTTAQQPEQVSGIQRSIKPDTTMSIRDLL